jgi:hypothetical protein
VVVTLAFIEKGKVVSQPAVDCSVPHEVDVVEVFLLARLDRVEPIIEKLLGDTN